MALSSIEWTEITWNPTTGCDKVSAGCKYCYAEVMTTMKLPAEEMVKKGNWNVNFEKELGYWSIVNVQIEGINF